MQCHFEVTHHHQSLLFPPGGCLPVSLSFCLCLSPSPPSLSLFLSLSLSLLGVNSLTSAAWPLLRSAMCEMLSNFEEYIPHVSLRCFFRLILFVFVCFLFLCFLPKLLSVVHIPFPDVHKKSTYLNIISELDRTKRATQKSESKKKKKISFFHLPLNPLLKIHFSTSTTMKSYSAKKLFNFNGAAAAEVRSALGEGPTWNANNVGGHRRTLSWVDVSGGKLFLWDTIANIINVIYIVHLEEDQLHYVLNMGRNVLGSGIGGSSGSGSSATANGLAAPSLVEGKPTIAGETETIGFAVPVAEPHVFLCGSQHGLFYLRTDRIAGASVSSHDDKNANVPNNADGSATPFFATSPPSPSDTATPATATAVAVGANTTNNIVANCETTGEVATTIRFYTFYVTMEQYIYALPPALSSSLPKFEPFCAVKADNTSENGNGALPLVITAASSHSHRIRFNDAKTDRSGRLFLGTMDIEERDPIGNLFVLDPEEHVHAQHQQHSHPHPPMMPHGTGGGGKGDSPNINSAVAAVKGSLRSGAGAHGATHFHHGSHVHTSFRSLRHALKGRQPTISNGIGWSPCNTLMFYVDSPTRRIDVFDYRVFASDSDVNADTSNDATSSNAAAAAGLSFGLAGRRTFADLAAMGVNGLPDGLTVDAAGNVWVALWGGGRVVAISPTTAQIVAEVVIPGVSNITSVCFGGPALSWLIITTAAKAGEPDSGNVFVAEFVGGAVGIPATEFKGTAFSPPPIQSFAAPRSATPTRIGSKGSQKKGQLKKDVGNPLHQSKL